MIVRRTGETPENPVNTPLFVGDVRSRPLVEQGWPAQVTVGMVRFFNGGRNVRHTHTADQVLYIVDGEGIVATDTEEAHVRGGDVVHVPAGEIHWHGAAPGKDMSHLSIIQAGSQTEILGDA